VQIAEPQLLLPAGAAFGDPRARLLIVGLAPGMHGANRTGRPFTGDHAGILLYATLYKFGLASAPCRPRGRRTALDGGAHHQCGQVPAAGEQALPAEVKECNDYLRASLSKARRARYLALGAIAHAAVLRACGIAEPAQFVLRTGHSMNLSGGRMLLDSYHCSRYNTQTRRLTTSMFEAVVERGRDLALRKGTA
jgi:uracil-DNA glycosylase family 4